MCERENADEKVIAVDVPMKQSVNVVAPPGGLVNKKLFVYSRPWIRIVWSSL